MPNGEEHIRVKNAIVQKSSVSVEAIKGKSLAKTPEYIMGIPEVLLRLSCLKLPLITRMW